MKASKFLFTFLLLLQTFIGFAQQNFNQTFLYGFKLPDEIKSSDMITNIKYKGKPLVPKNRLIAGKLQMAKQNFVYNADASNKIGVVNLPFQLISNTYYWLLDGDMLTEMAVHPTRYQIEITTTNKTILANYNLPVSFDFLTDNALNVSYLKSLKIAERNQLLQQKIWVLSIAPKTKEVLRDTILTYSIREKIPAGILKIIDVDLNAHANQEFELNNVLYYKKELFFPVPIKGEKPKIFVKPIPDQCTNLMTDVKGNTGYASGCITGLGSGKCSGILTARETIKYKVNLIIAP